MSVRDVVQKSMQRPARSQSPKRVGSGPSRPPISFGAAGEGLGGVPGGEPAVPASVISSVAAPTPVWEFVSDIEPDDDAWRPLDMGEVCQKPRKGGNGERFVCGEA